MQEAVRVSADALTDWQQSIFNITQTKAYNHLGDANLHKSKKQAQKVFQHSLNYIIRIKLNHYKDFIFCNETQQPSCTWYYLCSQSSRSEATEFL